MHAYLLKETRAYAEWREKKLNNYPMSTSQLIIDLDGDIENINKDRNALLQTCTKTNLVFYRCKHAPLNNTEWMKALAKQLGLKNIDANICADENKVSAIQNIEHVGEEKKNSSRYIPYTNKALNWHTDGYYNSSEQRIHAFLMHCVIPAKSGGENSYLDPEIAYILMRDENPDYIAAFMQDDAMTIPANEIDGEQIRPTQSGPVFFVDNSSQAMCMRFTARKRNIVWKNETNVQNALSFLQELLQGNSYQFHYHLNAGEGVICNNVLHNRTAFDDYEDEKKKRLLYRGRFYNRVGSDQQTLQNAVNN